MGGFGFRCTTLTGPASELGVEGSETLVPEPPQPGGPVLDHLERSGVEGVEPTGALGAHPGESALAQNAEMLGHGWLADPELGANHPGDITGSALTLRKELQDPSSNRITEDIKRVHEG